jgi:two-component system, chemotaxis family, CheB/CheR fusion protein
MPPAPGFACVVVVHLPPEHDSHLVELLQPCTRMPVRQVTKTMRLKPNHVYLIPPNANLNAIDTHLRLSPLEIRRGARAPVDRFLRMLAETHGETAVAVILSGAGSDGALGTRQIKAHGGLTIAQDPREAEYASMPRSAVATGMVDRVLRLSDMAPVIGRYCEKLPHIPYPLEGEHLSKAQAACMTKLIQEVQLQTGKDLSMYTRVVLLRRLRQRMRLSGIETLPNYVGHLREQPYESHALCEDLLLSASEFFRDSGVNETLGRALAEVVERKARGRSGTLRVWVNGCSTGEQAYSVAMLAMEHASRRCPACALQVFASDLSPKQLQQARAGIYPQEVAAAISAERLQRFFMHDNDRYRVRPEVRAVITFAIHDLLTDPPFAHVDLIICRDLLRALQPQARRAALGLFCYSLAPGGLLIVDPDDELDVQDLFTVDSIDPAILRRCSAAAHHLELPAGVHPFGRPPRELSEKPGQLSREDVARIFRAAVERYAPPSVLIDAEDRVVHFSTTGARYLQIPAGELTRELMKLVPDNIAACLRQGLQAVRAGQHSWQSEPLVVLKPSGSSRIVVRVERTTYASPAAGMLLVMFDDSLEPLGPETEPSAASPHHGRSPGSPASESAYSRPVRQEAETGASAPEVARALREAHEEVQCLHEELIALNAENRSRVETLAEVSNDLQHVLESTGLAMLLVDCSLNLVRYTPLVTQFFPLKPSDTGRPLADLKHNLKYENLAEDIRSVVRDPKEHVLEVQTLDARWVLLRVEPYRSALRGLEGVLVLLLDITTRKQAECALLEADRRKDEFLAVLAHELRNPLAPIGAGIEVLRKVPDDPALVQQVAHTMGRQTRQLVRLVDDLLEVGRISGGRLQLRIAPVQLAEIVKDAKAAVQPLIDSREHDLTIAVPEQALFVQGDAARLTQVVANLLQNAARYTRPRGRISLVLRQSGSNAVIEVRDNGCGMTAQALAKAFDMFYQAQDAKEMEGAGLGIGLALAKKLVEMHAGAIYAESAGPNAGCTFTVRLPLVEQTAARPPGSGAHKRDAVPQHKILIVDDNADAAESLSLLMTTMGAGEVKTAFNGGEALKLGAQLRPDIVLLDLSMPDMDGYEVARRMRHEDWGKQALLVALSGWGQEQHRNRSEAAGFDRHMTKPADLEALRAVLGASSA